MCGPPHSASLPAHGLPGSGSYSADPGLLCKDSDQCTNPHRTYLDPEVTFVVVRCCENLLCSLTNFLKLQNAYSSFKFEDSLTTQLKVRPLLPSLFLEAACACPAPSTCMCLLIYVPAALSDPLDGVPPLLRVCLAVTSHIRRHSKNTGKSQVHVILRFRLMYHL